MQDIRGDFLTKNPASLGSSTRPKNSFSPHTVLSCFLRGASEHFSAHHNVLRSCHGLLFALAIAGASSEPLAEQDSDVKRLIIDGIRSGWESVRTARLEYEIRATSDRFRPKGQPSTAQLIGSLWKDGPRVRDKYSRTTGDGAGDCDFDYYADDADVKEADVPKREPHAGGSWQIANPKDALPFGNLLSYDLLCVVPDGKATKLADWLEKSRIDKIEPVHDSDGNLEYEFHCLPFGPDQIASLTLRIIPKRNFPVRHAVVVLSDAWNTRDETTLSGFEDHFGILFPTKVTSNTLNFIPREEGERQTATSTKEISFNNVEINRPIDPTAFVFQFPDGAIIHDFRANSMYRWPPGSSPAFPLARPTPGTRSGWTVFGVPLLFFLIAIPMLLALTVIVWRLRRGRSA